MNFPFKSGAYGSGDDKPTHAYRKRLVKQIKDLDLSAMMTADIDGNPENLLTTDTILALNLTMHAKCHQ